MGHIASVCSSWPCILMEASVSCASRKLADMPPPGLSSASQNAYRAGAGGGQGPHQTEANAKRFGQKKMFMWETNFGSLTSVPTLLF